MKSSTAQVIPTAKIGAYAHCPRCGAAGNQPCVESVAPGRVAHVRNIPHYERLEAEIANLRRETEALDELSRIAFDTRNTVDDIAHKSRFVFERLGLAWPRPVQRGGGSQA